jgi:hypothetical protein
MEASQALLTEIENLSSLLFSPKEIGIILKNDDLQIAIPGPTRDAFMRGKLLTESKVRKAVIELASNGSSPAQILAIELIKQSKLNDVDV